MTEIKAVVFDYGCVLAYEHLESDLEEMAACLGVDLPLFKEAYWHHRLSYDAGAIASIYFEQVAQECAVRITPAQIKQCIDIDNKAWGRPNYQMIDWANRLRAQGIKIAILSNMPIDFREFLRTCAWFPKFDHSTYSCEVKSVKPSPEIYRHCLNGLGVKPGQVLFIDDRFPNIQAAKELGWNGFQFSNLDELHVYIRDTALPPVLISCG